MTFLRAGWLPAAFRPPATDRLFPYRVPAIDGGLPSPGDGVDGISPGRLPAVFRTSAVDYQAWTAFFTDRSITGCAPACGGGLPWPGDGVDGVSSED